MVDTEGIDALGGEAQRAMDAALDSAETFPEDIREQIIETYRRLEAERREWLERRKNDEGQA